MQDDKDLGMTINGEDLEPFCLCSYPNCCADVTHDKTIWHNKYCMEIKYWCTEHAPKDAELIDYDE